MAVRHCGPPAPQASAVAHNSVAADAQDADPTAFSSSCYEFWTHSLEERGDIHTARDVTRLARDSTFRAEFHDRLENWEEAMTVVKRFARSRTADRRDGTAFQRYRKRMPSAGPGFTEEVRLYSLELLKKASVSDAVGAVQGEVDRVERLYRESGVKQPGDDGACDAAHSDDERKVVSLADRLAVARTLLRHLPASPQVTSRGNFATWGSEGHVMVAALCVAIVVVICWVFQQRWRRATCRCSNLTSRAFGFKADRRWSSATGRCEVVSKQPDLRSEVETARSVAGEQKSQRQQRRRRKTKAATPVPNLDAAKATVEIPQSKGAVHTRDSTAGHLKPRKTTQPRQTVQAKPASTPVARNAAAQKETKSRRPVTNKVAATEAAPVSISKSTPPAETKATRDNCMVERVASIVSTDGARIADIRIMDAKPLRCPAELRHQQSEDHCAQLDAEPEQEQHAQNARVEQCVPQAHEVNSAVSEDLRAIAGRKRQLSQPVSDVSEISSVDGDTVSSAGSDAGSVSSRSGSVYAPISPSYVLHHPQLQLRSQQEQSMSWAQKLRSGMAARASAPPGMDTSDSDTNSISSLEDSYSFRSEAACRRRLSTVCSVNNTDGEEIADEASPDSHAMQHERERFGSSSAADSDGGGRRGRARSRAMRPACSSSDSESDQDLGARRARTSMPPLLSRDGAHPQCVKKVAAGPGPASTCHCIDEVWDGRLPEGVMAEKLSAADGGVLGRSAALGTIPFELQQPARHYLGVRPYRSWDASGGSTLSSVMESEAPGQLHERGSDAGDRGAASAPTPAASTTTRVLTRAWSVDTSNSAGIHRRQTDRSERSAVPPVVAPLPFGLRRDSAASSAPVTPSGCPSPILGTQSGSDSPRVDKANTVRSDSEGTGTNSVEPLKSSAGLGSSTTGATAGRAGPAAMAEMMRKADDSSSGDRPAIAHRAPAHHQAVPVPVPVPVHVQMWPTAPQPLHSMQTFADHIDASNAALVAVAEQRLACRHAIEQQILFYFSAENMSRDTYLRSNMDKDGYVSLGEFQCCHKQIGTFSVTLPVLAVGPPDPHALLWR